MSNQDVPSAVLFDMDGTLVDTEPYWITSQRALLEAHGIAWTDDLDTAFIGLPQTDMAALMQRLGLRLDVDVIIDHVAGNVRELINQALPWRPGAKEFLLALKSDGIPTALVTMSWSTTVESILNLMGFNPFDVVITGDRVDHGKPHPEPYLRAAQALGVDPTTTVAFEDSIPGVTSALAAGTCTIAVPSVQPLPANLDPVRWPTFEHRTFGDVATTYREQRSATNA